MFANLSFQKYLGTHEARGKSEEVPDDQKEDQEVNRFDNIFFASESDYTVFECYIEGISMHSVGQQVRNLVYQI
jgi:deoxyhypusine synthase